MRLTVPLSNGRAAMVEGASMTELLVGLHALDYPAARLDRDVIARMDLMVHEARSRHGNSDSAIGIEHFDHGTGVGGGDYIDPGDGGKPKPWVEDPVGQVYDSE
jgi:hypothetical protein